MLRIVLITILAGTASMALWLKWHACYALGARAGMPMFVCMLHSI